MRFEIAAACAVAIASMYGANDVVWAAAVGPPAPPVGRIVPTGPPPASLDLAAAIEAAKARSPVIVAAEAEVEASRARLRQAGFRINPTLDVEVENFAGTGPYSGIDGVETTVSVSQRLDLGGQRSSRIGAAQAALAAQELRLAIAIAELDRTVRTQFATVVAARDRKALAVANEARARELARIADELVAAGREPPLRALRARANAAQAAASLGAAEATDIAARRTLASLFGVSEPVGTVSGEFPSAMPESVHPRSTLDVRLAEAERLQAEAELRQQRAAGRLDPAVGIGIRRLEETGDTALIAGVSLPLPVFDRNQGNVAAARADIRSAEARRDAAIVQASARIENAATSLSAARARVTALERLATPQAAEALRLADLSYKAGRLSLLELLDAQSAFATAQSELIDARLALAEATATLVRAAAR